MSSNIFQISYFTNFWLVSHNVAFMKILTLRRQTLPVYNSDPMYTIYYELTGSTDRTRYTTKNPHLHNLE